MLFHDNEKCPVCGKVFGDEDDVVVCPSCGAPHHRECYHSLGKCAYSSKHSYDFSYEPLISDLSKDKDNEIKNSDNNTEINPHETENKEVTVPKDEKNDNKTCSNCGADIRSNAAFCPVCGEKQFDAEYKFVPPAIHFADHNAGQNEYAGDIQDIDGKSVADISATVRNNTQRFVEKFRKNKKFSWNWGAFVFGPFYMFYRKMYKEGFIALAVRYIAAFILQGIYSADIEKYMSGYNELMQAVSKSKSAVGLEAEITALAQDAMNLIPMMIILSVVMLIIHIVCAVFADGLYKKHVFAIIDKMDRIAENGERFNINTDFSQGTNLSAEQMRFLLLGKSGGVNIFAPIMIYCVINIILTYIPYL